MGTKRRRPGAPAEAAWAATLLLAIMCTAAGATDPCDGFFCQSGGISCTKTTGVPKCSQGLRGSASHCGSLEHCNNIVCTSSTDQHCKTAGDCAAGYTKDQQCGSVACTKPASLPHGTVSGGGGPYPGTDVSFACDDSYYLKGENTAQCGTDGEYTPLPKCSQCGSLEHCNNIVCTSGTDQHCKTAGDCAAGYQTTQRCKGPTWNISSHTFRATAPDFGILG